MSNFYNEGKHNSAFTYYRRQDSDLTRDRYGYSCDQLCKDLQIQCYGIHFV